jgi:hypothetical protein
MKAMPGVIAGMHFGLAGLEGEPTTAHMVGERTLNSRHARLDYKDKQLEREELEAWVADNPVVRGSTTTDCTYMQGEMFVQHDAFAPRGEHEKRSPRTMFVGIGPATGKSPTLCAMESFYRALAVFGIIFLSVFGSGCVDHAALSEMPLKYKCASGSYIEEVHIDDMLDPVTRTQPVAPLPGSPVLVHNVHTEAMVTGTIVPPQPLPVPQPPPSTHCVEIPHRVAMVHDWQDDHGDLMHKVLVDASTILSICYTHLLM